MSYPRRSSFVTPLNPADFGHRYRAPRSFWVTPGNRFCGARPHRRPSPWGAARPRPPGPRPPRPCRLAADARHRRSGEMRPDSRPRTKRKPPCPAPAGRKPFGVWPIAGTPLKPCRDVIRSGSACILSKHLRHIHGHFNKSTTRIFSSLLLPVCRAGCG